MFLKSTGLNLNHLFDKYFLYFPTGLLLFKMIEVVTEDYVKYNSRLNHDNTNFHQFLQHIDQVGIVMGDRTSIVNSCNGLPSGVLVLTQRLDGKYCVSPLIPFEKYCVSDLMIDIPTMGTMTQTLKVNYKYRRFK
jgi:hypothetical protein